MYIHAIYMRVWEQINNQAEEFRYSNLNISRCTLYQNALKLPDAAGIFCSTYTGLSRDFILKSSIKTMHRCHYSNLHAQMSNIKEGPAWLLHSVRSPSLVWLCHPSARLKKCVRPLCVRSQTSCENVLWLLHMLPTRKQTLQTQLVWPLDCSCWLKFYGIGIIPHQAENHTVPLNRHASAGMTSS